jgi:hypothetical protein
MRRLSVAHWPGQTYTGFDGTTNARMPIYAILEPQEALTRAVDELERVARLSLERRRLWLS